MRTTICIAILVLGSVVAGAEPVIVNVCGAAKSTPTNITVHRGERWKFEVIGSSPACENGEHADSRLSECDRPECAMWSDGKRIAPVPPTGWERWYARPFSFLKRVRSAHWYELTGAVGQGDPFRQTFAIGRGQTIPIEAEGALFLFANDANSRYENNYGSLRVRISRAD